MSDNVMFLSGSNWRCWNRKLGEHLISWSGFRNGERTALHEPVSCILTLHHSYGRTIIYRVFQSLVAATARQRRESEQAGERKLLALFRSASG